jgi:hypothetical protein
MPLLNVGTIPGGAVGNELIATTRRRFMPAVVVQQFKASPGLAGALAAAEAVGGGVSPITIPVQTGDMTAVEAIDYAGAFTMPAVRTGLQNAEFNLKAIIGKIPYYLLEGLDQQDAAVIPLLWARFNDVGEQFRKNLATWLWAASGANTSLQPFSFADVANTANPTQGNYGNIDRTTTTVWQGHVATITSITGGSTTITRTNVLAAIVANQKNGGGAKPSAVFVSPGFWLTLASDVIGAERYVTSSTGAYGQEGVEVAFPAIMIADTPVYSDLFITDNTVANIVNWDYLQYKVHRDATFSVLGPADLLSVGQLAYVVVVLLLVEFVCSKPSTQSRITGWTGSMTP